MPPVLIALVLLPAALAAEPATNGLNAATFYGPAFSNVTTWAGGHPGFERSPATNASSAGAAAAYRDLLPNLAGLQAAAPATYCDWGTRFEDGPSATLPYVAPARTATRAALWAADYALSNNLPAFADHALEALRISRNVGEDQLLITLMVQIAGEKPALELLAQHLDRLDDRQVEALAAQLEALPPGGTIMDSLIRAKAMFVDALVKSFLTAMRAADTNLFEAIAAGADAPAAASTNAWITENLRMASVVDTGRGCWIGFETKGGEGFIVSPTRPSHGIELLSADVDRGEAVIARGGETALVKLKSREITALRLRLRRGAANPGGPVSLLFDLTNDEASARVLQETGESAERFLAMLQQTAAEYDEWAGAVRRLSPADFSTWQADLRKRGTVLTRLMLPAVDKVREKEQQLLVARAQLDAAIAARRARAAPRR